MTFLAVEVLPRALPLMDCVMMTWMLWLKVIAVGVILMERQSLHYSEHGHVKCFRIEAILVVSPPAAFGSQPSRERPG